VPNILWVDDGIDLFTGPKAYLSLEPTYSITAVASYDQGHAELEKGETDLFIFDLILMRDQGHASLKRRLGMELARFAATRGVRKFLAYSVLSENEIKRSWDDFVVQWTMVNDPLFFHICRKGTTPVSMVVNAVRDLLVREHGNARGES
jgi:hypothetical protein